MTAFDVGNHIHYPGVHTQETSTIANEIGVNVRNQTVGQLVRTDIPGTIANILAAQADCVETDTGISRAGTPLSFGILNEHLANRTLPIDDSRQLSSALFTLGALTNGITPERVHARRIIEKGSLTHINLALVGRGRSGATELDCEFGESVLTHTEIVKHPMPKFATTNHVPAHSETEAPFSLDWGHVSDITFALVCAMRGNPTPSQTIEGRLDQLIQGAPHQTESVGVYFAESRNSEYPIVVSLGQRKRENNATTNYSVVVEEKAPFPQWDGVFSVRKLALAYDRQARRQPYKAFLQLVVNDPDSQMPIEQRARHFEGLTQYYGGENRAEFFRTLHAILRRVDDTSESY